jgi:acyl dehydratase
MPRYAFEDFVPGSVDLPGTLTVDRDEIIAFARAFDPQPFHIDEEAARHSFAGRLIASGWHSCAMLMRLLAEGFVLDSTSMGAPGVEEAKWLKPVYPGDVLRARRTVLETKSSRSRPEMGLVRFRFELLNQADEPVLEQLNWLMLGRRDAPAAPAAQAQSAQAKPPGPGASSPKEATSGRPQADGAEGAVPPYFENITVGEVAELGTYTFEAAEIIRFAKAYDPQPFHVDPEAARRSHFGGLCASGWHTAGAWMKRLVERRIRLREAAIARGEAPVRFGPSPGFRDLRWLKPVYAGDTLTFRTRVVDKRASASRPEWGLVFSHNTGHNQHGELVYEFNGGGFVERRPR